MSQIDKYVKEVLSYIVADKKMKMRIKSDLTLQLNDAAASGSIEEAIGKMGDPKDVAREFMDSINDGSGETHRGFAGGYSYGSKLFGRVFEYKSKARLFGIPLVHIKLSRYGLPVVAKGIIAIGTVSVGVVSIGAVPVGIISFGGAALGVISFGGLSLGLLLAMGGLAIGAIAVGGVAIGFGALGGYAIGEIAMGGYAKGTVAIGRKAFGEYALITNHVGPDSSAIVENLVRSAFPKLPDWIVNLISSIKVTFGNSQWNPGLH